jgi:nucleotide-binding universal stress UspA family protein
MFRSLLVPLDGSAFAEHALPLALAIARRANATLRVVYVHTPFAEVYPVEVPVAADRFECEIKTRQRVYLEDVVRRVAEVSPVPTSFDMLEGAVAPMIRKEAGRIEADLVVMTTHGRGALARFWLGSVADKLVRDLPMPLLLVRPTEAKVDCKNEPALKHILVPLDGSPRAESILEPAIRLGSLQEADYTLLRTVPAVVPAGGNPEAAYEPGIAALAEDRKELEARLSKDAVKYLEGVAQGLRSRAPVAVQTKVVLADSPAKAILLEAASAIDVIALATHGRRGLPRVVLGSVADKVIRGSHLPVLVHRPGKV